MALGPAHTTAIGGPAELLEVGRDVEARAVRPGRRARRDGRRRSRPSRTPGSRPRGAAIIVADTVVAAQPPSASAIARLGRAALRTDPAGAVASASRSAPSRPTSSRPSWIATVAGTAPLVADRGLGRLRDLEVLRIRQAVADEGRLEGDDRRAAASAAATSGATTSRSVTVCGDGHAGSRSAAPTLSRRRERATPMTARRHPPPGRRRGARPGRRTARPPSSSRRSSGGDRYHGHLLAIPLDERPARSPTPRAADQRRRPRHAAAHLPGRPTRRVRPRPGRTTRTSRRA